ncbi:MAG TPA: mechanosensitive ion channel family protein [Tissierellia bacterium]|nr:mechanosensitive ion channel family protein [Tissierellia bacterium]
MINWDTVKNSIEQATPKLLGALVILIIGLIVIRVFTVWLERYFARKKADETRLRFLFTFLRFSLTVVLILSLLEHLGSFTTTVTTIVGAITLSIGLAMQGALSNLAGGIIIVASRPFVLGDLIETVEFDGTVTDIGILTTTLTTPDNKKIIVPNGKLSADYIVNHTAYDIRRVDVPIRFETVEDLEVAKQTLLDLAVSDERVLDNPKPDITSMATEDYRSALLLKAWVKTDDYWPVFFKLHEETRKVLVSQQVGTAIPTMNVILNQVKQPTPPQHYIE